MKLPEIASFLPHEKHDAIHEIKRYLIPGGQKTKGEGGGLLPALGIVLKEEAFKLPAKVLPAPVITAAGLQIKNSTDWGRNLQSASFRVDPRQAVTLSVVVFHHSTIKGKGVFDRIRDMVNSINGTYRFPNLPYSVNKTGDTQQHWGLVEKFFSSKQPANVFVLDFTKPRQAVDPAYSVVKHILAKGGYLSQFVNFKKHDHANTNNQRRSDTILYGVARQILCKCGMNIWWASIPKSLPLPAMFIGIDVFHSARTYDPKSQTRVGRSSCAAIVIQITRSAGSSGTKLECYSQTFVKGVGEEYKLGPAVEETVKNAMKNINVVPKSCVVWRDGVGDTAFVPTAADEVGHLRKALNPTVVGQQGDGRPPVPVAYMLCQKRIATRFFMESAGRVQKAPVGTLVQGISDLKYPTFYINGTSPPYSTPKPARFVLLARDAQLNKVSMSDLSWSLCHGYQNWPGPIK